MHFKKKFKINKKIKSFKMIWKKINDYDNYSISEEGQVRNDLTGYILKNRIDKDGYFTVALSKNSNRKDLKIHRLLCKCFKDDFQEYLQVDHIDKNRQNNNLENLRMVNNQQNSSNQNKTKSNTTSKYKGVSFNKATKKWTAMIQNNLKAIFLGRYETELEAAKAYNDYIDQNNLEYYSKNIF